MLFAYLPLKAFTVLGALAFGSVAPRTALVPAGDPVEVSLYDVNHRESTTVHIGRDGSVDPKTKLEIEHAFRCKRTGKTRAMDQRLLAMIAEIQLRYPGKTIHYISGYRGHRAETRSSPHRAGRALDLTIPGVSNIELRDYMWREHQHVGVGYYPHEGYIHIDNRPDGKDTSWTFRRGKNQYDPSWAQRARDLDRPERVPSKRVARVGV